MTTFQDQPWSRRAVREGDGGPGDGVTAGADGELAPGATPVPPEQQTPRQVPLSPRPGPEPLSYVTQQRFGGDFRIQRPDRFDSAPDLPPTEQIPTQDRPSYRPRDYSPEGRSAVPSWAPSYPQNANPYPREGAGLDYHTQARPDAFAARAPQESDERAEPTTHGAHATPEGGASVTPPPADAAPATPDVLTTGALSLGGERTITRRELRALREAEEARAAAAAAGGAPASPEAPSPSPFVASPFAPPPVEPVLAPSAAEAVAPDAPVVESDPVESDPVESAAEVSVAEAEPVAPPARPWSPIDEVTVPRDEPQPEPVALVEPPEPARWAQQSPSAPAPGAPSVFEALFTPRRDEPVADTAADADVATPPSAPIDLAPPAESSPFIAQPPAADAEPDAADATPGGADAAPPVEDVVEAPPVEATVEPAQPQDLAAAPPPDPSTIAGATAADPFAAAPPAPDRPAWAGFDQRPAPISIDDLLQSRADAEAATATPTADPFAPVTPTPTGWTPVTPPAAADAPAAAPDAPAPDAPAASSGWQRSDGEIVDAEVIAEIPAPPAEEPHPVVIDATPLPAEPIERHEAPAGHWTTQAADDAPPEFVGSREVHGGHGVITTNALVLPAIPQPEFNNPLAATGEILITGSIELPRSLSATGAHEDLLEELSLDHELDPGDHQVVSTESAPVRAVRAVSTHTNSGGVIAGLKPRSNKSLTVLIIATASMAAIAAGLLIVGLATGAF